MSAATISQFVEVNVNAGTDGGLLLATSGFTQDVYSQKSEIFRANINIGGEAKAVSLCQAFVRAEGGVWTSQEEMHDILLGEALS